uniref:UAA transporter n=1 Tax=Macrostomum lignano TaxID=282301 RepID=A0A1I8F414_9PLAT
MSQKHSQSMIKFLVFALGIFISYFVYGLLQEKITKTEYGLDKQTFTFTCSMVLIQCAINAAFAVIVPVVISSGSSSADSTWRVPPSASVYSFALAAFTYITAMWSSNAALQFVLGKSCKPIPVMLLGLLFGKRYPMIKYLLVLIIVVGVSLFLMKDSKGTGPDTDHSFGFGEFLLLVSLLCDGLTGLVQDRICLKHNSVSSFAMMFQMNFCRSNRRTASVRRIRRAIPHRTVDILLFSLCSALGQLFIFATVVNYGPLNCSLVTTTRKFFTILGSVILFGHPLTNRQWLGTCLVFVGLFGESLVKRKPNLVAPAASADAAVANGNGKKAQ